MSEEEKHIYAAPFPTIGSRKPIRQWPLEIPIDGKPADVHQAVSNYSQWLQTTELPKLLFYAHPGGIINAKLLEWCRKHFKNLQTVDIGKGVHYLQEDNPHLIGGKLAEWVFS